MEALVGFKEPSSKNDDVVEDKSCGYKLVPWISWDEWNFVRDSLFSSSPHCVASALHRIMAWRSRGCVPVVMEVTTSIIEIQQKDPFFRVDLSDDGLQSEEMLAMLYCMAIMRLVNGVVEKTRKQTQVSIAEAADAIGIPRMLIDIRHEGSHRDLPSLRLVRLASVKALDWLKSYYWEPQQKAIQLQGDKTADIRKEIKSTLRELAFCLKAKQNDRSSSLKVKGKRVKRCEHLGGHNKFLSLMAGKQQSSKSAGSKKQIMKTLKKFIRLYYSFSSEVVSVLLEILLKALDSVDLIELPKSSQICHSTANLHTLFDDWKPVIVKLSNKEPEVLLTLLTAVIEMIETQEAVKCAKGKEHLLSEERNELLQFKQLSYLFGWLVKILKGLKPVRQENSAVETEVSSKQRNLPKETMAQFLRKCLLLSSPGNNELMVSALTFARMMGNNSLSEKLNKLSMLSLSNPDIDVDNSSPISFESFISQQEASIRQAAANLEYIKLGRTKTNNVKTTDGDIESKSRWGVAKTWNRCPIGMLPCSLGTSGRLPVLDLDEDSKVEKTLKTKDHWEINQRSSKRGAGCSVERLDNSSVKKLEESETKCNEVMSPEGVKGRLMIDGAWKKVTKEELLVITSAVRILI